MRILVTGAWSFIGYHLARQLIARSAEVIGIDDLNDYNPALKLSRLRQLEPEGRFAFHKIDISDTTATASLFKRERLDGMARLAAPAGVGYWVHNPPIISLNFSHLLDFRLQKNGTV